METNRENMIDFITGTKTATVSFTNQKYINKIKKLYESHKEEFDYMVENKDGSVCARIPLSWIKITPPKQMSEEQKQAASERLKQMWADKEL